MTAVPPRSMLPLSDPTAAREVAGTPPPSSLMHPRNTPPLHSANPLANRPVGRSGSLPPAPTSTVLASARPRTQSSDEIQDAVIQARNAARSFQPSPLALSAMSADNVASAPPSPTMPAPDSLPEPPPLPEAAVAEAAAMPSALPPPPAFPSSAARAALRPSSLEMPPTNEEELRRNPANAAAAAPTSAALRGKPAPVARALGRGRVVYGSSDSITLPSRAQSASALMTKSPGSGRTIPTAYSTSSLLPPPPAVSAALPPPPVVDPAALSSALAALPPSTIPRTAPIVISGADTTVRLTKQPSSIPALSNPRSQSPVTKLVIGSLTPQRYCSPEPQPMPAFEDIPEGQVYDPDFLFSLIESDTFAAPKPPASAPINAASASASASASSVGASASSSSSSSPSPSPLSPRALRPLPASTHPSGSASMPHHSVAPTDAPPVSKGGSLGRATSAKSGTGLVGLPPPPAPLPAPDSLPAPPAPPETISLFDLVAPEKLEAIRLREADRPKDPTINRKSLRLSLRPPRSSLDSLFSLDAPPLPPSLPETLQTAAPPMSIVSEEPTHASTSEEISPAELESLRAQVQAIDEAAVPQQTIVLVNEPEPDLDRELTEMVDLTATVSLDDATPADKQAEVDWLLADDDGNDSDDGWGLPEEEILKNRLWTAREDDEWERTLKAMEEDAQERLRDELEDEDEQTPPTQPPQQQLLTSQGPLAAERALAPEPEAPVPRRALVLKVSAQPARPDTPIRTGTPTAPARQRSDSALAVMVRPGAKR